MRAAAQGGKGDIARRAGVCGGKATIGATRVRVNNVVFMHKAGQSVDEIREAYPDLSEVQVQAALVYYGEHTAEIEAELARDDAFEERFERLKTEYMARREAARADAGEGASSCS